MKVREILAAFESFAPARWAFDFDRIGLQVGDPDQTVVRAVVSLDRSLAAVAYARESGAQLLLSHHPLIFSPLAGVREADHVEKTVRALIRADLSFIAAHTNWDCAPGGINDALLAALGLETKGQFGLSRTPAVFKAVVFVPASHLDAVRTAAFAAGGGRIGLYRECSFASVGTGTFFGEEGSQPAIGTAQQREEVAEYRLEIEVPAGERPAVEAAIRQAHPYEEVPLDFYALEAKHGQPGGRYADLPAPQPLTEFSRHVFERLQTSGWVWGEDRPIRRVAVVGGAADGEWRAAQAAGADVLITGEVKQHVALEATESGFALIAAGHYATEQPGVVALANRLRKEAPTVEWDVFVPAPGTSGRPW